jgi:hypothetical protein
VTRAIDLSEIEGARAKLDAGIGNLSLPVTAFLADVSPAKLFKDIQLGLVHTVKHGRRSSIPVAIAKLYIETGDASAAA